MKISCFVILVLLFTFSSSIQGWNLYSFGLKYYDGSYQYMKYTQHFCNILNDSNACFNDIICIHFETQADIVGLVYLESFLEKYDCNDSTIDQSNTFFYPGFILGSVNVKMQFSTTIVPSVCNSTLQCIHDSICNYSPKNQGYIFSAAMIPLYRPQCNSTLY
jgi:hypothetical protein